MALTTSWGLDEFYAMAGTIIDIPARKVDRPDTDTLAWHMVTRFLQA